MGRSVAACALVVATVASGAAAQCVVLASHPDGRTLAQVAAPAADPAFSLTYVHSVTRTPVAERYRIDATAIVQTEIRFSQHGPGLPTEADAEGAWRRENGVYVVSMKRRIDNLVMRVHADQSPRLVVPGDPRTVDLAQWGDRALAISARPGSCLSGPASGSDGARAGPR